MKNQEIVPQWGIIQGASDDIKLIERWFSCKPRSPKTIEAYAYNIECFRQFVGYKPLVTATQDDILDYATSLYATKLSPNSVRLRMAAVKSLYTFLFKKGDMPINIGIVYEQPTPTDEAPTSILTDEEIVYLLAAVRGIPRDHAMLWLGYHCGLRITELISIKWEDCTARTGETAGQIRIVGKGNKPRIVLVSKQALWDELMSLPHDSEYVFTQRKANGKPRDHISRQSMWYVLQKAAKAAGITKRVHPHLLRHTHATHAIENGCNLTLLRDSLGHSDISTTNKYLKARPNESSSSYIRV